MEEILKEELRPGEKVLWTGKPDSFETLDVTNKTPTIRKAVLTICIVTALCILYLVYASSNGITIKPAVIIVAMVCAILGALNFISVSKKMQRMSYAITDQRIISAVDTVKSVDFALVKEIAFKTDADGHTSILIGQDALKTKPHQWRSFGLLDPYIEADNGICSRFVMYAVNDAEKVKEILSKYIPI